MSTLDLGSSGSKGPCRFDFGHPHCQANTVVGLSLSRNASKIKGMIMIVDTTAFLTAKDFAKKLKLSPQSVRRYCWDKSIRGAQKVGRDWLIPKTELKRYRREHLGQQGRRKS